MAPGRDHDWGERPRGRQGGRHAPAWSLPPIRSTSPHLGHDRPAQGRRARQRRPHGRAEVDDVEPLRDQARRGVLGSLRRRAGSGTLLHLLRAAAARGDDDRLRGQAGGHAGRGRLLAGCLQHKVSALFTAQPPSAPSRRRIRRAPSFRNTTCPACARCSSPASAPTPRRSSGRRPTSSPGDRSLVADRDRVGHRRQSGRIGQLRREARLSDGADARLRPAGARRQGPARRSRRAARSPSSCRCRRPADAVEQRRALPARATSPSSPATTTSDAGFATPTATCSSWRAPTMSSTSPATASRRARWRRSWRATPGRGVRRGRRGRCDEGQLPLGFVVLNAGVERSPAEIEAEIVKLVRDVIGPVAAFKNVLVVKRLPKTRSGKILRGTMRQIADGEGTGRGDDRRPGDPGRRSPRC